MKISGNITGDLEVKRFCMDGLIIILTCPVCGKIFNNDQYLNYPEMNKIFDFDCYCTNCEHEWVEKIRLNVNIEAIEEVTQK